MVATIVSSLISFRSEEVGRKRRRPVLIRGKVEQHHTDIIVTIIVIFVCSCRKEQTVTEANSWK